jgi:uncharacterized coiled-coil DUF342 family protein
MSLRDKLKRGEVELHVPPVDPGAAVYKQASTLADNLKQLVDERDQHKQRSEWAFVQLEALNRQLQNIASERDNWRRLALRMVRTAGSLGAKLKSVEDVFRSVRNEAHEVEHLLSQLPDETTPQGNGEDPINLDAPLVQPDLNPTQEDIEQIRNTLAKLPQQ